MNFGTLQKFRGYRNNRCQHHPYVKPYRKCDSDKEDEVIRYIPSSPVKYESKKQGYVIELNPVDLRLIKYTIDNETYVCCTTLLGEQYPLNEFPAVYHGRRGIEELYKISKEFVDVEEFHSRSEHRRMALSSQIVHKPIVLRKKDNNLDS